jgi:diazepam-binding inhibitor (GABA receptor modulating acyl-CoA-binding protein)
MSDLAERFAAAAADAQQLPSRPSNDDLLRLYGYYKQGSLGDVTGSRPGMMDFVGRAKYDAWSALQGMSQEDARQAYVDLVDGLKSAGE